MTTIMGHGAPRHTGPAFPGPMPGQQSPGLFQRGANSKQHGFPGTHQQQFSPLDQSSNEQLAFFSIHKPINAKSWDEATPVHHRISSSDVRKSLAKFQLNPNNNVKDILVNLKSDSARRVVNALVQEQNEKLMESDPTSMWVIAGLDVQKETIKQWPSQKRIIKSIEVILKTEPTPFNPLDFDDGPLGPPSTIGRFERGGSHMNHVNQLPPPPINVPPFQGQGIGRGLEGLPPPPHHVQPGPPRGSSPLGGHNNGPNPLGGPHLGSKPQVPVHGPHPPGGHMPGPHEAGIPPPPPHGMAGGPIKHTKVIPPHFDHHHGPKPMPGGFPESVPGPRFDTPKVIDPHKLKHQKSKSNIVHHIHHEYQDEPVLDYESESSDGGSFSGRSVEGGYAFVERSRSRGRGRSLTRSRSHSRVRSTGRHRIPKVFKAQKSHSRSRSGVDILPGGKHHSSPKNSSSRSSASALPTQPIIHIHNNNNEHNQDRERERNKDRGRQTYSPAHDRRRSGSTVPSPEFSTPMYIKRDKYETHPMARPPSVGGSDTGSSVLDGSSIYTSDDSVFSEPTRARKHSRYTTDVGGEPRLRSRTIPIPRDDPFAAAYRESRRRNPTHYEADDYPPSRPRGFLHEDHILPHYYPQTSSYKKQAPNPFDPRYPARASRSYAEVSPPYARLNPYDFSEMEDQLHAKNYMSHAPRSSMPSRRHSMRGRMDGEFDEWAYRPHAHERLHHAYRHMHA